MHNITYAAITLDFKRLLPPQIIACYLITKSNKIIIAQHVPYIWDCQRLLMQLGLQYKKTYNHEKAFDVHRHRPIGGLFLQRM